jgi:hypothetical protein
MPPASGDDSAGGLGPGEGWLGVAPGAGIGEALAQVSPGRHVAAEPGCFLGSKDDDPRELVRKAGLRCGPGGGSA